jgi:hypothetical protein
MPQCMSRDPRKRRVCFLASSNGARQPRHGCRRRPEVAARMRLGLIERISADTQGAVVDAADAPAEHADLDDTADTDAGPADCGAVNECIGVLDRLQVPITAGAPAARTALRGNGFRYSNAVVAAAVKHRKELSRTVRDADAETFEVVVV